MIRQNIACQSIAHLQCFFPIAEHIIMSSHCWIEIHLERLEHNFRRLKELFPNMTLAPVLKSDAYGHGAVECARRLEAIGAQRLAVFSVDEALELRRSGIATRIWIIGGALPEEAEEAVSMENVAVGAWNRENIQALSEAAVRLNRTAEIHLAVDTGMSRLGFFEAEMPEVIAWVQSLPGIRLAGLYSHLASPGMPDESQTTAQRECFARVAAMMPACCREIHLAALPGLAAQVGMEYGFGRPGVAVYGYGPGENLLPGLEQMMEFKSRVISVKTIPAGRYISYGMTYRIGEQDAPQRIAVVPIGYADGYPRLQSNRGRVLVHGSYAPIRGRVCMGMVMVDVTAIPDVRPGDEVVLLGHQGGRAITADEIADNAQTISYEVLCNLGKAKDRRFIG